MSIPPYPLHESVRDRLHPEYVAFYNTYLVNLQQAHHQSIEISRNNDQIIPGCGPLLPVGRVEDILVKRKETNGPDIPVRCFVPEGEPQSSAGWPLMMYYHGGGWVFGNIDSENTVCTNMCIRAKCVVITTEYRLAPENRYPSAVHDCWESLLWAVTEAVPILQLDVSKVAIGGASAGGNLAAVIVHKAMMSKLIPIRKQLLVVPVIDNTANIDTSPSWKELQFTAGLSAEKMMWYRRHYLPNESDWMDPEASPIFYPDQTFTNSPPALILVGELDVLRYEGERYAKKLMDAGVKVDLHLMLGMPHPFLAMDAVLETGKQAITYLCDGLSDAFA